MPISVAPQKRMFDPPFLLNSEYTWLVRITPYHPKSPTNVARSCTGVLFSPTFLLTSATCFVRNWEEMSNVPVSWCIESGSDGNQSFAPPQRSTRMSFHRSEQLPGNCVAEMKVAKIPGNFNSSSGRFEANIALVNLQTPLNISQFADLPSNLESSEELPTEDEYGLLLRWPELTHETMVMSPQSIEMRTTPGSACKDAVDTKYRKEIHFCADELVPFDATFDGATEDGVFMVQRGPEVLVAGLLTERTSNNRSFVFIRVSYYCQWINASMSGD